MKYDKNNRKLEKKLVVREQPSAYGLAADMKRLTIDVSVDLHSTIKSECARRGLKMADAIRDILEREFKGNG